MPLGASCALPLGYRRLLILAPKIVLFWRSRGTFGGGPRGLGAPWGGTLAYPGHDDHKKSIFLTLFGGHLGTLGATLGHHFVTFFVSVVKNTQCLILTTLPRASLVFEVRWVAF